MLLPLSIFSQAPNRISYQAIVRNTSNDLVTNATLGVQISILQTTASGTALYIETHAPTTNANGLMTLEIGNGTVVSGNLSTINFSDDAYFIRSEVDVNGGSDYGITGVSQLLSVPYALHANTVSTYNETDPEFTAWNRSEGISITTSQISDFTPVTDTNTQLTESQVDEFVANNGFLTTEVDDSVTNEIELPVQTDQAGKFLTTDGTEVSWVNIASNNTLRTITTDTTLLLTDAFIFVNGTVVATLPAAPTDGLKYTIMSKDALASINGGGKDLYAGGTSHTSLTFDDAGVNTYTCIFSSSLDAWFVNY